MSVNHIYPEFSDSIVARWKKVSVCALAGTRLNPDTPTQKISFVLQSADSDTHNSSYNDDVIELYSEREKKVFETLNRALIEQGLLVPFHGTATELATQNSLTDTDISHLLQLHHAKFKKELVQITSAHTLKRIQSRLTDTHAQAYHKAVAERLESI